jgi:phosphosulfolactate synthase
MSTEAAFDFLARPPRTAKPRRRGLSVVSDKSKSLAQAADIVETMGDIIDHIKMPDHVGLMWRNPPQWTREKNALYNRAGIDTLPGGIPFQVAAVQGKVTQFMERIAGLGFKGVEVSEDSIELAPAQRLAAIACARANGLTVYTELGKKFPDSPLDADEAIAMANRDLEAGVYLVVIEKSDVALAIERGSDALHRLMRGVDPEHLIIECGPGEDRFRIARWLIREFGPDVNLENIDAEDAFVIEAMRHGLHRQVDYNYFHPWKGRPLPQIPAP